MSINISKLGKGLFSVLGVILLIFIITCSGQMFENIPATDIVVIQGIIDGKLHVYSTPGVVFQNFGKVTHYQKRFQFYFSSDKKRGSDTDQSIRIRFNDSGHGTLSGEVSCENPTDPELVKALYQKYSTQEQVEQQLIYPTIVNSVYMTGPLMSSVESSAGRRAEVLTDVEDQASNGIYKRTSQEIRVRDAMTGIERTVTQVTITKDTNGIVLRNEQSPLKKFGIHLFNLSISEIAYDKDVEDQIQAQRKAYLEVQTAVAEAKKAEQAALTVAKQGEATAAQAKWAQEAIKAKAVTEAQQQKEVAQLQKEAAESTKQRDILLGEGEAEKKRLIMAADGALAQKLDAYVKVQTAYAQNFCKQPLVPSTQILGSGSGMGNGQVPAFIDLLTAKTLRDLNLDMSASGVKK